MEQALTKPQIIAALSQSPHASKRTNKKDTRTPAERLRDAYFATFSRALDEDPEFFAHLIAWNHNKGEIRDAKAALPVIVLRELRRPDANPLNIAFVENALAHLADLNPKLLVKALEFNKLIGGPKNLIHRFVTRYLRDLEADPRGWETVAVQHRTSLSTLYARYHVSRGEMVMKGLNWRDDTHGKPGPRPVERLRKFGIVKQLPTMSPVEIVAAIDKHKLPWLIARGALGTRATEPDVLMAFMSRMTAADLATSAKWLVKAGVKEHAHTRAAFEDLLAKAAGPRRARGATLKASKAAKVLEDLGEEKIAGKLRAVQEKQLEQLRTIEGDWLVLADKSGSMAVAVGTAVKVAAILARSVQGRVWLVLFDTSPRFVDATGQSYEALSTTVQNVVAGGGTSIGCGLRYALDRAFIPNGIALISDGCENTPPYFAQTYHHFNPDNTVPVYWYEVAGDYPTFVRANPGGTVQSLQNACSRERAQFISSCEQIGLDIQQFDLRRGVDEYSLPNVVQTMRAGRYALLDEIMSYKLHTLDEVLTRTVGMRVWTSAVSVRV